MNLEEEMVQSLAEEFRKTEEFEILANIMVTVRGYTRVEIDYGPDQKWIDVVAWVGNNCTGDYQEHLGTWVFELAEEATMFRLRFK